MSKYDQYFLMKEKDIAPYVQAKLDFFAPDSELVCEEIGDGNLNYVYRLEDKKTKKSIIVKQAGHSLRISKEMKLSVDRNRIEAEIISLQADLAPGLVPKIYYYDTIMSAFLMEDLSDHSMMRQAMLRHEIFPQFADDISSFMVNTLLDTSDLVMDHQEKKERVKQFINPELCEITEDLVLSEIVEDFKGRNQVFKTNRDFVEKELYQDQELRLEVAKLKFIFMNKAESLIHGDLHTGSVFIKKDSTIVFDPEFAFYGPMGYDIGNVIANLIFAWQNGNAYQKTEFCQYIKEQIVSTIDLFLAKFKARFKEKVNDKMAETPGFLDWYLAEVLSDTAGYTGTELLRRTVGLAQNIDVTSLEDEDLRTKAERINILAGKKFIKERAKFKTGQDFLACLEEAVEVIYDAN